MRPVPCRVKNVLVSFVFGVFQLAIRVVKEEVNFK
jgi:hypothetical protein